MSEISLKSMLENELSSEEQKMFLDNFQGFIMNDPEVDYCQLYDCTL